MTARSPHVGIVELEPTLYRRSDDPVCAQRVRDGLVNGALHQADSCSQVRINWQPASEAVTFAQEPRRWATGREAAMAAAGAGEFYTIEAAPFGTIDVPCFGTGAHYEFRLRTAWGAAAAGYVDPPPAATVTVRIYFYPWGDRGLRGTDRPSRTEHERLVDHVWQASYAATTVGYGGAWLTGATRGAGNYANKIVLDRESTEWPRDELVVPNAAGGADRVATRVLRVAVGVVASVSLDPGVDELGVPFPLVIPLMRALHLQGFVGAA